MKKKSLAVVIIIIIALLAAAIAGVIYYRRQHGQPLTLYGNVDIRTVNLGFRVGGRLARLTVDEGDIVHPGQVLAKLDDAPYRNALAQAQANVDSAAAKLDLTRSGYRGEEIAQVRSQLAQLQAAFNYADSFYHRQQGAWAKRAISADQLEDALAAGNQAKANLQAAKDKLQQYQTGNRPQEITAAAAALAQAQAALDQAALDVTDTMLAAPSGGTVLTRAQEAGSMLSAGDTVFTLSLTRPVWVRAYIDERNLSQAAPGTRIIIRVDGLPDKAYHGKIGFVSPTAEFTPKNVETPELRTDLVYRLRIIVTDADDRLRQGMPVTLDFADGGETPAERVNPPAGGVANAR
ncbi:secretion protein HlyD [Acerihabitans arboris]|uniref:Secretion protein HlyD n=1 Tax=Acerihabitans arboris TaxID=2691583 RepID=A0A845SSK6_9GAMM|nr:secretion protein HlyD [Acerihabitans arboris]NDL64075.1 secretion protein HlyD [Acerihabitans arboris]